MNSNDSASLNLTPRSCNSELPRAAREPSIMLPYAYVAMLASGARSLVHRRHPIESRVWTRVGSSDSGPRVYRYRVTG